MPRGEIGLTDVDKSSNDLMLLNKMNKDDEKILHKARK